MSTAVTAGIRISVEAMYRPDYSDVDKGMYLFLYHVTIENTGDRVVQLLSRKWDIFDVNMTRREVKGKGVIGQQPILNPGDTYKYSSACDLNGGMGRMQGNYTMQDVHDDFLFEVRIPTFEMYATHLMS